MSSTWVILNQFATSSTAKVMSRQKSKDNHTKLRDFLRSGTLQPGERLPGERELAGFLGVGRTALRPVLEELEAQGFLRRQPQSGTFLVAVPPPLISGTTVMLVAPFQGAGGTGQAAEAGWLYRVTSAFERTARYAGAGLILLDQSPHASDPCSVKDMAHWAMAAGAQATVLLHPLGTREKIACALSILHDHEVHPVIVSARTYPGLASQVYFDSGWGAYLATRHLLTRGHTRIGFAGASVGHEWVRERLAGYRQALAASEVAGDAAWVWLTEEGERLPRREDGDSAFERWRALPAGARPTALVAANDVVALGILGAARAANVAVPGGLSVIGFDNDPEALLAGLTTIERPTETLGEAVAQTTLERLAAGPQAATVTLRLRPVLIERATVSQTQSQNH